MKIVNGDRICLKGLLSPRLACSYISTRLFLAEVTNMDLFWSGLARRASEHIRNERRSQFSKVFETAIQDIEIWKTNTLPDDTKRSK